MIIRTKWNKRFKRIKNLINDEVILHYEVGVLLTLLIVSVTIAWFLNNPGASVTDITLQTAEVKQGLIISNTIDGGEFGEEGQVSLTFNKDQQTKLMPGSEGMLTMYVTSVNKDVTSCSIYLEEMIPTYYDPDLDDDRKEELQSILAEHILFYYPDDEISDSKYIHPITDEKGYKLPLNPGEAKEVTVYWIWPYSYAKIPQITDPKDTDKNTRYDMEDSKIGGYVNNIAFKFRFETNTKETS